MAYVVKRFVLGPDPTCSVLNPLLLHFDDRLELWLIRLHRLHKVAQLEILVEKLQVLLVWDVDCEVLALSIENVLG